ncbi:hypothetical protein BDZ94DRAFT_1237559 [Collybia nuda]|uniref:HNH nuclease domain-containing protein n=1 Tax=Collybia nuda TaxID=64659 RepID=A0A9P5Y4P9_9AGAR|nr:hypothetical protein BDZ94DRAFT_1237559 [Collybia nuda]
MDYKAVKKSPWNKEKYVNEHERDVHIWCMKSNGVGRLPRLGLVGGCYTHGTLKINMLYEWIAMIIKQQEFDPGSIVLVSGPDPRNTPNKDLKKLFGSYTSMDQGVKRGDGLVEPGHYLLYIKGRILRDSKKIESYEPVIRKMPKKHKKGKDLEKDYSRSDITRRRTLLRDQRCVITGYDFPWGPHVPNDSGFQVAHLLALFPIFQDDYKALVPLTSPIKVFLDKSVDLDKPYNTMLMRADIHAYYDDYQFSVWHDRENELFRIVRFEKYGAPRLDGIKDINLKLENGIQKIDDTIEEVDVGFLLEQTRLCVHQRFSGEGKVNIAHTSLRKKP